MTEQIDIYRAANLLIKQHGDEAAIFAAQQADACARYLFHSSHTDDSMWSRMHPGGSSVVAQENYGTALKHSIP